MYESLRLEPPVPISSSITMTETSVIGGVTCQPGDMIYVNINQLHHNEDQWGADHNTFKPERFEGKQKH
jgi:cytochrome P450